MIRAVALVALVLLRCAPAPPDVWMDSPPICPLGEVCGSTTPGPIVLSPAVPAPSGERVAPLHVERLDAGEDEQPTASPADGGAA